MERLRRKLSEIFKHSKDIKREAISLSDEVRISLVKEGQTIRIISSKNRTWTSWGLWQIRNWLAEGLLGTYNTPNSMCLAGDSTVYVATNPFDPGVATIAGWKSTFGIGIAVTNVTAIRLTYNDNIMSEQTYTAFDKLSDIEMRVEWRSTLSAG